MQPLTPKQLSYISFWIQRHHLDDLPEENRVQNLEKWLRANIDYYTGRNLYESIKDNLNMENPDVGNADWRQLLHLGLPVKK